ncbi:phosphatidate cytidylyltransferase [Chondromyces crocatus]|uniref:Phosphatidate cytidylyltransferase n=1 Tax=Chondromyces crocatus TaxID=52 RepID=A0A0K1ECR8_CHOCO|nr:phosphatidate cytidylyltransferase [Chondromyces crocatus]AKT38373.1 phosphatidate cytidylyltransferase [Chondromyces crocatus]
MRSNLIQRLFAAAIAIPLLLALLYLGPPWGWAVFLAVATSVGALELFGMTHPEDRPSQVSGLAMTLVVYGVLWRWGTDPRALLVLLLSLPIAGMLLTLARLGDINSAALRVAAATFGPLYLGGGMAALALLRRDAGDDGPGFVVLALTLSWFSDTGAYFAGRFLGKHKLYEAVSPKKTIEGAIGGLVFAVLGALVGHFLYLRSLPALDAIVLGVVAGALGQAGDLGESLLKRSVNVKDSGGIIPGHGGILDRVDALLVTATLTYFYILFWWQH